VTQFHHGMSMNPHFPRCVRRGKCRFVCIPWWNHARAPTHPETVTSDSTSTPSDRGPAPNPTRPAGAQTLTVESRDDRIEP
jgi:hypothetical protein